ncbi:MAG: PEP-CTERM sorting domain-containing protein [Bryobacteraceae bacterium]
MIAANGATINPLFYSGPNGGTGAYTYFDDSYNAPGAPVTTPYAALSGGLGDLTNGVTTTQNWGTTPGPYVGWLQSPHTNGGAPCSTPGSGTGLDYCNPALNGAPSFLFDFSNHPGGVKVNTIGIHLDDSNGLGSVRPPLRVEVNGGSFTLGFNLADPVTPDPKWYYLDASILPSNTQFTLTLFYQSVWIMVDEIMFDDSIFGDPQVPDQVLTPEPATIALSGAGLAALALLRRKQA